MNFQKAAKFFCTLIVVLVSCYQLFAQRRTVTGKITNQETGQPIADVTVNVKGTTTTVTTDISGAFETKF